MKAFSLALALSLIPSLALGATTWTADATLPVHQGTAAKAVCTTGTEAAPTLVTDGLPLAGLRGFVVHAEAAGAMTAGGKLVAYLWNPVSARWNPSPDLDLVVQAVQFQSFAGFVVAAPNGRVAYAPSGVGQAVTLYVVAY